MGMATVLEDLTLPYGLDWSPDGRTGHEGGQADHAADQLRWLGTLV